jgi:two-component system phosphate regulon response regulator OmpR
MKSHILIVDDDNRLRVLLKRYLLQQNSFYVSSATTVFEAKQAMELFVFDCLIVDIMMPGGPGTQLLTTPDVPPILLLSAMGTSEDRIQGLELGAHDYLVKPFDPKELLLRLSNIIDRYEKKISFGNKIYYFRKRMLICENNVIPLSHTEDNLLHYMASRAHQTISRQEIASHIFPNASNERIVDVQINRLRKKIETQPQSPCYLLSYRGQGYCLKTSSV